MSLGTLALIGLCGLAGPFLSIAGRGAIPVVVGEILVGVIVGRTGFQILHTGNPTLLFLSDVGYAMLMFSAGMNVPLREQDLRSSLDRGARAAGVAAVLAVGAGVLVSRIGGAGHPAVYAVIIASGSAAVVLPIIQERRLTGRAVLSLTAQVTVADVAATIAIPFVLRPSKAVTAAAATVLIAAAGIVVLLLARRLATAAPVHALRHKGKRRHWAIDLRLALIVLFGFSWIAERTQAS